MTEALKPNYPKTKFDWCLGRDVPVNIWLDKKRHAFPREGTVTALDPKKKKGPFQQQKGLFLDGAIIGRDDIYKIEAVVTKKGKKDVTSFIKQIFGPGL